MPEGNIFRGVWWGLLFEAVMVAVLYGAYLLFR
jgi:hypothetical protein